MHKQAYTALKLAALGDILKPGGLEMLKESLQYPDLLPEAAAAYSEATDLAESIKHLDAQSRKLRIYQCIQGLISDASDLPTPEPLEQS